MPELPVLSGAEMIKRLERLGFEQVRQRGSHVILRRGAVGCVVPMHDPLKRGTMAAILRQAQLTREEFIEAIR
ncbi:type II toxin-antitoxin system HicA family toxin [Sphingomonas sp. M1A8_2b]